MNGYNLKGGEIDFGPKYIAILLSYAELLVRSLCIEFIYIYIYY